MLIQLNVVPFLLLRRDLCFKPVSETPEEPFSAVFIMLSFVITSLLPLYDCFIFHHCSNYYTNMKLCKHIICRILKIITLGLKNIDMVLCYIV